MALWGHMTMTTNLKLTNKLLGPEARMPSTPRTQPIYTLYIFVWLTGDPNPTAVGNRRLKKDRGLIAQLVKAYG